MLWIVFGVLVVLGLTAIAAAFLAGRPRGKGSELDPPPKAPRAPKPPRTPKSAKGPGKGTLPPPAASPPKAKRRKIPSDEELARQAAEVVAEAEALLAAAQAESAAAAAAVEPAAEPEPEPEPEPPAEPVRPRFRDRLGKARGLFGGLLGSVRTRTKIDEETWDELEEALIRADVGVAATTALLDQLRARVKSEGITTADALVNALKEDLKKRLTMADRSLHLEPGVPNVWLFVGVNGVGKTTTIGKLGKREREANGRTVVMAAGDTFRAAAAEQLELWAKRADADLVRGAEGGDPSAVVFDAVERAAAKNIDIVLADTAGRLHTKTNLMEELGKIRRVADRPPGRVTEVLLVIDATTGQNGLVQARQFAEAVDVTGVVLTKLDGTAKGGIALAIQTELDIPIKLVGLGETIEDLIEFDPEDFIEALFD
ncbi:MAG: fused signal recognition particle receptor [Actinomycetota bacterium]|nr:fused signal recognition particle receptor [Actinomycetota bacterium]